jgi:hypothetical protein
VFATAVVMLRMLMLRVLRGGRQSQRIVAHEKRDLVAARRLIIWIDAFVEREQQVFVAIRAPNQRGRLGAARARLSEITAFESRWNR